MTPTSNTASRPLPRLAKFGTVAASIVAFGLAGCAGMDKQTRDATIGAAAGAVAAR